MASPLLLRALGLYVRKEFLDPVTCAQLVSAMRAAPKASASVHPEKWSDGATVDEKIRRTRTSQVGDDERNAMTDRLAAIMPDLECHFGVSLHEITPPQFLTYTPGDFFIVHRDRDKDGENNRLVSIIIFLQAPGPDSYTGGELKVYGAVKDAPQAFTVTPEPGLLLAFRSEVWHEVLPVIEGIRHTVVSWYS